MSPNRQQKKANSVVQWIHDGPELPVEILELLQDGNLVLFCGAGISVPAGLPTFPVLTNRVCESFPGEKAEIKVLIKSGQYDRAFFSLENQIDRASVRRRVYKELQLKPGADTTTHDALLKLATGKDGKLRLVTTNFDLAFESRGTNFAIDCAPKLPTAKKERWNSVVYLHGRMDNADPTCENLILSSADFGLAYLTERWASPLNSRSTN